MGWDLKMSATFCNRCSVKIFPSYTTSRMLFSAKSGVSKYTGRSLSLPNHSTLRTCGLTSFEVPGEIVHKEPFSHRRN